MSENNSISKNDKLKMKKNQISQAKEGDQIGKYGIYMGERGIYDTRNKLNNLTGKEWIYFTNSVWITAYFNRKYWCEISKNPSIPKTTRFIKGYYTFFHKA